MGKGSKSGACKSTSHQLFKDKAKNRVDDLQGMFNDLQSARKESRSIDVSVLEEQVHQMLREWKSELNQPSPASSLQQGFSLASFASDFIRELQHLEEEDDATSALAAPKPEPDAQKAADGFASQEGFNISKGPQQNGFELADQCKDVDIGFNNTGLNNMNLEPHLDFQSFDIQEFDLSGFDGTNDIGQDGMPQNSGHQQGVCPPLPSGFDSTNYIGQVGMPQNSGYQQGVCPPPPSAFLGPKCALWDCPRPALGLDWSSMSDNYCSIYHSTLAPGEAYVGCPPVVRPGGISLKDNLLFGALISKAQGKEVGIPECEGAATAKSPWNATELFDVAMLDGETIREWLFFDKPRRAFETGNRKQRSLPDYSGRGWHESRKQVMNEYGGLKRSYYMDPQPIENYEWHLYEYEINKNDTCALYRLEVKRAEKKKISKGKLSNDSVADLQKQMRRLTAEFPNEKQRVVKGRGKANVKDTIGNGNIYSGSNVTASPGEGVGYGRGEPCDYLVDSIDGYYI